MLPKANRLVTNKQFITTYKNGVRVSTPFFLLYFHYTNDIQPKIGFVASKKTGKAYQRNLIKRKMRQIIYHEIPHLKSNLNLVFVLSSKIIDSDYTQIQDTTKSILTKYNLTN
jgi:ribonuclease P protein component